MNKNNSLKEFDKYVKTLQEMEEKITQYLMVHGSANYSKFYFMFSARRREFLRELLEDLVAEDKLVARWRRDPGQPPVRIYSLSASMEAFCS